MLSDLLTLETLFDRKEAALYLDDLIKHYHLHDVFDALNQGHIITKTIYMGQNQGRCLCWLSDSGRCIAAH